MRQGVSDCRRAWADILEELTVESSLTRENRAVLDVVQAALGLISGELRAISVRVEPGRIILFIAVHARNEQVEERRR